MLLGQDRQPSTKRRQLLSARVHWSTPDSVLRARHPRVSPKTYMWLLIDETTCVIAHSDLRVETAVALHHVRSGTPASRLTGRLALGNWQPVLVHRQGNRL